MVMNFFLDIWYNKVNKIIKDTNIVKFYYDEFNLEIAKSHLSQNSLFGDKNSLVIKSNKFVDVENLIKIVGDNYFYFFYTGDAKKAKTKIFKNNFVRFFKPDLKDLIISANEYMKNNNITNIDINHLKYLISKIDYRFLFSEIDKLSLVPNLNNDIIDKLVFDYNETSFDEVFDSLFLNQDYLHKLDNLLQMNEDIAILMSFVRYVKILYMFNLHIKNIGYENVSRDVLGYQIPKHLEETRKRISFTIKEDKFLEIFEILLKAELDIKSSKDKTSVLFRTFIEIKSLL